MSGATVLYDAPGPRARARNRLLSLLTIVFGLVIVGGLLFLMFDTDQFSAGRLAQFQYAEVQRALLQGYLATLKAAAIAAVLALLLGAVLAAGRRSDRAFVHGPSTALVEFFRAVPL